MQVMNVSILLLTFRKSVCYPNMVPVLSPDFEIETESSSEEEAVQEDETKEKEEEGPGLEALVKPVATPSSVTPSASTASLSQVWCTVL